jgi:hypothetical protein
MPGSFLKKIPACSPQPLTLHQYALLQAVSLEHLKIKGEQKYRRNFQLKSLVCLTTPWTFSLESW